MRGVVALSVATLFAFVFGVGAAWSAPVLVFDSVVTSSVTAITGLPIAGADYDVDFFRTDFRDISQIFAGTLDWTTQADANAAGLAVSGALNAAGLSQQIYVEDAGTGFGDIPAWHNFLVPWAIVGANGTKAERFSHNLSAGVWVFQGTTTAQGASIYAKFSPTTPIPEPSTLVMLAVGILGLSGTRTNNERRQRRSMTTTNDGASGIRVG